MFHLDSRFAAQWALLYLSTTLLFCSFSILNFNNFSFVRVCCAFAKALYVFFQAWDASFLSLLSAWYYNLYVDGITIGVDFGTDMGYLDGYVDGYNDGKLGVLLIGGSLVYTDGKVLGSDEGIKLGISYGKLLGTILLNLDVITLRLDVGTDLVSLDRSCGGSNDGKFEGLFHGDSLGYTDGKVHGSD